MATPSFNSFAVKTLFEPTTKTAPSPSTATDSPNPDRPISAAEPRTSPPIRFYVGSPALYTTPEAKPIPPGASAQPDAPSPYIFNRKRREVQSSAPVEGSEILEKVDGGVETEPRVGVCEIDNGVDGFGPSGEQGDVSPRSVVFFDADEEFFSDGSVSNKSSSHISNLESELCSSRLALLEETERRKTAEEVVNHMRSQWQRIGRKLSQSGLTFSTASLTSDSLEFQAESESVEQLIQELVVTRACRDQVRAEAELAAAAVIESKNQEISQLRDRLQYYETVNREMSHRNIKVSETARRQREVSHRRRWLWGCIGVSVAVGASAIAYSYYPRGSAGTSAAATSD